MLKRRKYKRIVTLAYGLKPHLLNKNTKIEKEKYFFGKFLYL